MSEAEEKCARCAKDEYDCICIDCDECGKTWDEDDMHGTVCPDCVETDDGDYLYDQRRDDKMMEEENGKS